jgi:hypothetical protein
MGPYQRVIARCSSLWCCCWCHIVDISLLGSFDCESIQENPSSMTPKLDVSLVVLSGWFGLGICADRMGGDEGDYWVA